MIIRKKEKRKKEEALFPPKVELIVQKLNVSSNFHWKKNKKQKNKFKIPILVITLCLDGRRLGRGEGNVIKIY